MFQELGRFIPKLLWLVVFLPATVVAQNNVPTGPGLRFDFDTKRSPLAPGHIKVTVVKYSLATGFGWERTSGLSSTDGKRGDALVRDVHTGRSSVFVVNIPNGAYHVTPILGDRSAVRDKVSVWAEGHLGLLNVFTRKNEFVRPTFGVNVSDGQLNLRIADGGGKNKKFSIAGLEIVPVAPAPPAPPGPNPTPTPPGSPTPDPSGSPTPVPRGTPRPDPTPGPSATPTSNPNMVYDIVAVRAPRYGNTTQTTWQEVAFPAAIEPGQDLVYLHRNGTEEVLIDCSNRTPKCSVVNPSISFNGEDVYYSFYPDATQAGFNFQRGLPWKGADIYKLNLATRQQTRLTNQEWTPNTGVAPWAPDPLAARGPGYRLGYGILNLGPSPITGPDGKEWIVFSSNRNGFINNGGFTNPCLQLYIMDGRGRNVRLIGHFNLESALHPTVLTDGRIMFSSGEAQGARDSRMWGLWAVKSDGRTFEPLMSAFADATALHFQTQLSDRRPAVVAYYNLNNNGFGSLLTFNFDRPANGPAFGSPNPYDASNPLVRIGVWFFDPTHPAHQQPRYKQYRFSPLGLLSLTAFTYDEDSASPRLPNGEWAGKVTHPSGAPNNDTLLVYSPGPVNDLDRPTTLPRVMGGIYLLRRGQAIDDPAGLVPVKVDPSFNYQQPRAVVTYADIYGIPKPATIPYLPDGDTPFGFIGTSSFYNANVFPGTGIGRFNGLDPFNTRQNDASSNWSTQGAVAGLYRNEEIHGVRIVQTDPSSHLSYGTDGHEHTRDFRANLPEKLKIIAEIPLRKLDGNGQELRDGDGNPDTSFLARIPADVPFTFQTINKDGIVLNSSQTWHQVRPGEQRFDCGGCHAHANRPTDFAQTAAARSDYQVWDVVDRLPVFTKDGNGQTQVRWLSGDERITRMTVEYYRDIRPILERSCVSCHSGANAAGRLDLADPEAAYKCLTNDTSARCGAPPLIGSWRQTNASRWVRVFQARRSLLVWKIFGRRLDGWTNQDHPTETVPGDVSTFPAGEDPSNGDLDYTGTIMPPPGSNVPPLSEDEKMTIARWIDLGAPANRSNGGERGSNWFADDLRPTLNISWPPPYAIPTLGRIEFVAFDNYTGLDMNSLRVTADFAVNGSAPGTNLSSLFAASGEGRWTLSVGTPPARGASGTVTVKIADKFGNITEQQTTFSIE